MAAPILHQGVRSGNIYVGSDEPGREFTKEDEETLVMFASQAALVIANARRHRDEQRARAGLETLIDTSPVGVVVLDARTGAPVSFNREAARLVEGLLDEGQRPEDILDEVTCVRSDGREVSLREFPLAEVLRAGDTVRAEEFALRVADGRSASLLLNASPIHSEDGQVASFVITLQDMAPLEEQERLRGRVPGHGEPRAAVPPDVRQGVCRYPGCRIGPAGPQEQLRVLSSTPSFNPHPLKQVVRRADMALKSGP